MKIPGGLGQGKVSNGAKNKALARKLLKNAKAKTMSIDSTTVTLDQWGDHLTTPDATFVKYNRTDTPVMPLARCPDKVSRATLDAQYYRAESAIRSKFYMEAQLKDKDFELTKARKLIERMTQRLLDNGDL